MTGILNFELLAKEVLTVIRKHDLEPSIFSIHLAISGREFDALIVGYPNSTHSTVLEKSSYTDGIGWNIQIQRRLTAADFPSLKPLTRF